MVVRRLIEPGYTPDVRLPKDRSIKDIDAEKVEKLGVKKLVPLVKAERRDAMLGVLPANVSPKKKKQYCSINWANHS